MDGPWYRSASGGQPCSQHAIALKTPSRFGDDAVVDWMQWSGVPILAGGPAADRMPGRLRGESLDRLGNPTFRLGLQSQEQSQEQHIRGRGPVDHRPHKLEDDGGCSRGRYSSNWRHNARLLDLPDESRGVQGLHQQESVWGIGGACEVEGSDLREDRRRWIPGQRVSAVIARRFGWRTYQKRESDRIGAALISCWFRDARRDL